MGIRVGIDLGTTYSVVAKIDSETSRPVVIKNNFDSPTTPSVLCFEQSGNVLFGEDAKNMQAMGDINTASFFKRSMGSDDFLLDFHGNSYTPTDLSAILLSKLKEEAQQNSGESIDAAVITVPAYFSHKERAATIEAGKKAGLDVIAIINEPTAAVFAYGLNEKDTEQTIMIYDLGGGTFDVSIAKVNNSSITILGSDGNHELGGKDWDDCIANYLIREFQERHDVDMEDDLSMMDSMLVTAESVKKQLSARDTVHVPINYGGIKDSIEITVELFESISEFTLGITKDVIERLLESLSLGWHNIDGVILVGGSTRMRMIHNYVKELSGRPPLGGVNVDEAVALGAAIRANITEKGETLPSIGGRKKGGNEAPVVAIKGAKAYTDATAHTLGMIAVSTDGERYINSKIINKNAAVPASDKRPFTFRTRAKDNELEVYVLQGEFERPLDNTVVSKYVVTDIKQTNLPESTINVTYRYTENGVIEVTAEQQETGKTLPIRIEPVPDDMSWTNGSPKDQAGQAGSAAEVEVLLAIDLSGSMYGEPIKKAKKAMNDFVNQMDADIVKIGIIAFADSTKCTLKPTSDYETLKKAIDGIDRAKVGYGNRGEPFSKSHTVFSKDAIRYIVVLTDGCWYGPNKAISEARKCHAEEIEVMALGFGTADHKFLKKIASVEEFASMTELSQLSGSFSKIAQTIGEGATGITVR